MWEGNSIWNFPFLPRVFWKPMDTWLYPLSLLDSNQQMEVLHPGLCHFCGYGNVFDMTKMRISLVVATSNFEPFRNVEMSFQPGIPLVHLEHCRLSPS